MDSGREGVWARLTGSSIAGTGQKALRGLCARETHAPAPHLAATRLGVATVKQLLHNAERG